MNERLERGVVHALMAECELSALELSRVVDGDLVLAREAHELNDLASESNISLALNMREYPATFSAVLYLRMSLYAVLSPRPTMLST